MDYGYRNRSAVGRHSVLRKYDDPQLLGARPRCRATWGDITVVLFLQWSVAVPQGLVLFWIMWPHGTARKFIWRLSEASFEELVLLGLTKEVAAQFLNRYSKYALWYVLGQLNDSYVELDRSPFDMLIGRLRFRIGKLPYEFVANRGTVVSFS